MRKRYRYLCLPVLLSVVAIYGGGSVLAEEAGSEYVHNRPVSTSSDAEAGISGAGDSTPSDKGISTPSDAVISTPSNVVPDEIVLLMDIPAEGCRTQEELVEQLLDDSRDRIVLASDIEWSGHDQTIVTMEKEVEMGEYRIHVGKKDKFDVTGPVAFYGEGSHSLFEVQGYFAPKDGVEIHASGDQVVAVDILGGEWAAEFVDINATGRDARAVRIAGSPKVTVNICHIVAEGEDSVGIEADGDIRLFLSSVSGEKAAVSSEQEKVLIFGSSVSPQPEHARILPALAVPGNRLEENGFCIETGSSPDSLWEKIGEYDEMMWCFFAEGESFRSVYQIPVTWSGIPTDFSIPGTSYVRCSPADLPEWFPADLYDLEIPVHTVSPDSPFIMDAEDAGSAAVIRFFAPIRDARDIRVEYSEDDRESWRDSSELTGSFVTDTLASIEPLEANRDYWFRVVVTGGPMEGVSNEILFVGDEVRKTNTGGDRDHGDRDDQGEEPPKGEIIPPPVAEEPDTEGADTEEPDTEGADTEEPDTEGADTEEPNAEEADVPGSATSGTDAKNPDTAEKDYDRMIQDFPSDAGPSPTDITSRPSGIVTPPPDGNICETAGKFAAAVPQEPSRFPHIGVLTVLIPGVIVLGGGVYVCWKKRRRKH